MEKPIPRPDLGKYPVIRVECGCPERRLESARCSTILRAMADLLDRDMEAGMPTLKTLFKLIREVGSGLLRLAAGHTFVRIGWRPREVRR